MIKIICDYCEKEIPDGLLYGIVKMPMLPEINFCSLGCFDHWLKNNCLKKDI
jgi:hypothetical protein